MSDLAGFQPIVYEEPENAAELKRLLLQEQNRITRQAQVANLKTLLATALAGPIRQIRDIVERRGHNNMGVVSAEAWNVSDLGSRLRRILNESSAANPHAFVRHWALDMAEFWKTLVNDILHERSRLRNLDRRCLMIDPIRRRLGTSRALQ